MKLKNRILALVLSVVCVMPLAACGERGSGSDLNRPTDNTKTQLNVFTFGDGESATRWLKKARDRFEAEYAETDFEPGKKGVQINIDPQKLSGTDLQIRIPSSNDDIFFGERMFYNDYVKAGLCLDITDIVTEQKLPGEKKTIADKMTESQQEFFTVDGKIYGVPHYSGGMGIAYNVDFFDDNALYFKKDWKDTPEDPFTSRTASDVSEGPDGKPGTYDDGLPVTYEEFYVLCDYIADNITSAKPLLWNGVVYDEYLTDLMFFMYADYEGADQFDLSYTMDGTLKHAVKSISDGNVELEKPFEIEPTTNGYEVYKQAGKYYATEFMSTIIQNSDWYDKTCFSRNYSHLEAQKNFLLTEEYGGYTDYAMLIDGNWWESECDATITNMVQKYGDKASKYTRNFGWMPLPRPDYITHKEQKYTMCDDMLSFAFIKSTIDPSKIPAAKTFLQFVNTDISLIEYTETTNTPKALLYEIPDKSKLSNYGRSFMTLRENSNIVFAYNGADIYRNNAASFGIYTWQTQVDGTVYKNPIEPLRNGASVKDVFDGIVKNGETLWNNLIK